MSLYPALPVIFPFWLFLAPRGPLRAGIRTGDGIGKKRLQKKGLWKLDHHLPESAWGEGGQGLALSVRPLRAEAG